ncbi:hypothetical protein VTN00DRAFT_7438 [Thermoascus crustaceus]|uniref:uncharacterized protein n=1 Tax=Thermoascus crustaceus TaxID=5088 RepID=UPI003742600A
MSRPVGRGQPRLGATFYPGGADDFYMPEVISPSPQRVMPEVPENMQDNIAHLEQEARGPNRVSGQQSSPQYDRSQFPDRTSSAAHQTRIHSNSYGNGVNAYEQSAAYDTMDQPNFSPFPVLRNPPPNVPPTDEQKEANLEKGRVAVLASNDPEMQLAWAQDALTYVEVAMQNELRMSLIQPPRPQTPQIERQLRTDAMNIVNFLADQHHPKADFMKGMWLEFGKFGYRVDKKEAFRCYARAAEKGYARAEYRMGMQFESSNEPAKAIKHYERGVALGDSASYYRLGMMILLGQHGQHQDYQIGLDYIRLAAQTCDENAPQGAYVYGMLLARELPQVNVPDQYLPLDLNGARINIEKAAYHGFAKAQVKMGAAYELCQLGCDFNPALSLHYNLLAARQGEPEAEMAISKWFLCGHEGVFEKNDEMAFTYAQRAAQSGLPTAEFALGYFYEIGIYVPVDIKEARSWYAKAAANGNKDATSRIESISRSKTLSRKDHEKVAIARIKSQYGSHGRNSSIYSARQSVAPIQENLEMPDPSKMRISDDDPMAQRSAAPYPDGPGSAHSRPGSQSNYYGPDPRPSSAFGINPNIRPPPGNYAGAPPPNRAVSGGAGPMGYRQQGSPMHTPMQSPKIQPGHMNSPTGAPKLDIGYSAPMDPPGPGRRRPPNQNAAKPYGPPDGRAPVPQQGGQGLPQSPRPSGPPSSGPYPPRSESLPPSRGSTSSTPASKPPQKPETPPAKTTSGGLPGKGPKTFEEMGVPQGKTESDCVVM